MNPLDKLREDVEYWREAARTARETLRIAESVLPGLEAKLLELEPKESPRPPVWPPVLESGTPEMEAESPAPQSPPRFTGQCIEQTLQALVWKPDQSSDDLKENLEKYGRAYGRGAIGYALRELRDKGLIFQTDKRGNLAIYRPTPEGEVQVATQQGTQ